jgi:hypothetical protein
MNRPSANAETIDMAQGDLQQNPGNLICNAIRELQIPKSAVHKVLHNHSKLHTYSIHTV